MFLVITDVVEKLVLILLFGLSVWSIAIMIDRFRVFQAELKEPASDLKALREALISGDRARARTLVSGKNYFIAQALSKVLSTNANPERIDREISSFIKNERDRLERGLSVLATLGANAPFIGLFGTVLGIIRAFAYLGTQTGTQTVMSGVSQALYATAAGILVAIPAVVAFNAFSRQVRLILMKTESLRDLIVASQTENISLAD
jgi:biopolymer transport protein ExbB